MILIGETMAGPSELEFKVFLARFWIIKSVFRSDLTILYSKNSINSKIDQSKKKIFYFD
jgi:hypothetical protein